MEKNKIKCEKLEYKDECKNNNSKLYNFVMNT